MTKKGIVSTLNTEDRKARIFFSDTDAVTPELPISSHIRNIEVNNMVLVEFWGNSLSEGVITENLSATYEPTPSPDTQTYTHTQISAAKIWTITHSLGRFPSVTVVDSAGSVVMGDTKYISENEIQLSFSAAFAGRAYLN